MDTQKSSFNRNLAIVLIVLIALSIAGFSYANWAADPGFTQWWMILLNIPILGIPLVLLFGSIYLLVVGGREYSALGQIQPRLAKVIHWSPRAAAIMITFFVSLFSLDAFEVGGTLLEKLGGFLMHSLPAIGMLVLLFFAWKRPLVGFAAFFAAGAFFAIRFVRDIRSLPNLLLFVFPLLLVAGLFYADWKWLRPQAPAVRP